jgi:UbiA prenyltransferase family
VTGTDVGAAPMPPAGAATRCYAFIRERAPLRIYLTYAVLWVSALTGSLYLAAPRQLSWKPGPALVGEIVTVWLVLLFVRIADEQKDFEYDRVHHPERPLPRGAVTVRDLRLAMAAIVVAELALNAWRHPVPALWLLLDFAYMGFVVWLDRRSARIRESVFIGLLAGYPVQLMLSVHVWLVFMADTRTGPHWSAPLLIVMFACAFLHFEFARKTRRRRVEGAQLYSNVVGVRGAVALTLGTALSAALIDLFLFQPWQVAGPAGLAVWLPPAALWCLWTGADRFLAGREAAWPASTGMAFLAWFYLGLAAQALATGEVTVAW